VTDTSGKFPWTAQGKRLFLERYSNPRYQYTSSHSRSYVSVKPFSPMNDKAREGIPYLF